MKITREKPKIKSEILAVVILGISIFLLLSLISFRPSDFPLVQYPPPSSVKNYGGWLGAYISGIFIYLFGLGSYVMVGIIGAIGWNKLKEKNITRSSIAGMLILLFISCTLLNNLKIQWNVLFSGTGGLIGKFFADICERYLGSVGSYIILGIFFLLSILLTTEISLKSFRKVKEKGEPLTVVQEPRETQPGIISSTAPEEPVIVESRGKTRLLQPHFEFMDELYEPPPLDLLAEPKETGGSSEEELLEDAKILEETLNNFGVSIKVVQISRGPVITRFEVQPAPGVKVSSISNLSNDLALGLSVPSVRIEAPVPGKAVVGIEIPNKKPGIVYLRELIENESYTRTKSPLTFCLGKSIEGTPVVADLEGMPHLLIAGATGSGKSVFIHSLILSFLFRNSPDALKLVLIDPKMVELSAFDNIPHLILPVIKDVKEASSAMKWVVREMEDRYDAFLQKGVHAIREYNQTTPKLPYLVVIIDELADLMLVSPDIEDKLCRVAQMGRAVGIHLVLATQRPSVDIITGLIKANFPSRISFAVSTSVDSRTILDISGAEKLLGKGDMLFSQTGSLKPMRIQGAFVSHEEVNKIAAYLKTKYGSPDFSTQRIPEAEEEQGAEEDRDDQLFIEAVKTVIRYRQASTSLLQRRLKIGYNRAARIIDAMYEKGIIGPQEGSKPRDVLVDESYLRKM